MREFFRKLTKIFGYTAATIVILLAIAVGLFRLFLPRLPEYQDQIKVWASDAIGMEVEFSGMNARWAFSGPELEFYDAELVSRDDQNRGIAAEVVSVGISLNSLVFEGALVVDRVVIRNTSIEIHQLENDGWWVQGMTMDELPAGQSRMPQELNDVEVVGEDIEIQYLQLGDQRPDLSACRECWSASTSIALRSMHRLICRKTLVLRSRWRLPGCLVSRKRF